MPPTIPAALLKDFVTELFVRSGLSPEHAHTTAEVLVWASVRGIDSHGVARVPRYLELLSSGEANPDPELRLTSTAGAVAVLDADRAPGPLALTLAAREAVARARTSGIGAVGVRRTVHTGAIGYYTSRMAEEGLAGIAFVAGMPNMGYPGVRGAAVATSPLSIAVPAQGGPPVLLDMATAGIALGKITQYRNSGQPLPAGVAATEDGTPTTDPTLAKLPLPLGGAKGAGMSLLFELITSVLLGAPILASVHGVEKDRTHRQNALIVAIDPAAFGTASYPEAVRTTVEALKTLPVTDMAGESGVTYPGERSAAIANTRAVTGIPVVAKVWRELEQAATRLGVTPPLAVT